MVRSVTENCNNVSCKVMRSNFFMAQILELCWWIYWTLFFLSQPLHAEYVTPHQVIINTSNVYPGGFMAFDYYLVDIYGNMINDSNISMKLSHSALGINTYAIKNGHCEICDTGLYVQGISIENVHKEYNITVNTENTDLVSNNITIKIKPCPSGYGVAGAAKQCVRCSKGTYSFGELTSECIECDDTLEGIECLGGDNVLISYNYWMRIGEHGQIISSDCPNGRCCQYAEGCDFKDKSSLCATNRNVSVPLCGRCDDGFSELLGTSECGLCDGFQFIFVLLPAAGLFAVLFSIYLLCFDHSNPPDDHDARRLVVGQSPRRIQKMRSNLSGHQVSK